MHGLNMHMGRYEEFDFFDYLGGSDMSPNTDKEGPHASMERVYGINK
jgi:hypothetical protein